MLKIKEDYFRREVRDGYLVGELVKRAWAVQLDILCEIDELCKKYDITYFAYWGTLLGAVRHHGFIPWDDDLDIAMPRPSYNRFLEIAQHELPSHYHIINNYVEEWDNSFTRVTNGSELHIEPISLAENYNCPFSLGIDIFPLDYITRNKQEAQEQKDILSLIGILMSVLAERKRAEKEGSEQKVLENYNISIAESLITLEKTCGIHFEGDISLAKQLNILYDQIASLFTEEESDYLTDFPGYMKSGYVVRKEWFENVERIPFENITIPVPSGYDYILRKSYGDYSIPVKGTSTHGDICFRPQVRLLAEHLDLRAKKDIIEQEQDEILKKIKEKICVKNDNKKVILICNDTYETIVNDTKVIEKLRAVFTLFRERENFVIWWRLSRIDLLEMDIVSKMLPQLTQEYQALVDEYIASDWGILDPGMNIEYALEYCNAYYGVENKISRLFQLSQKPVMIMDFNI